MQEEKTLEHDDKKILHVFKTLHVITAVPLARKILVLSSWALFLHLQRDSKLCVE